MMSRANHKADWNLWMQSWMESHMSSSASRIMLFYMPGICSANLRQNGFANDLCLMVQKTRISFLIQHLLYQRKITKTKLWIKTQYWTSDRGNIYKHNEKNEVMSAQKYKKNLKQYLLQYKSEWDERIKKPKAKHNKTILEYIFTIL